MNILDNGTVMPSGLLHCDPSSAMRGFNRTFKNTAMRMGIVMKTYPVSDSKNITKLTTEYDVIVNEQDEAGGVTPNTYRNCISTDGFGSIADFFERTFRAQTKDAVKGDIANTKDQDGAIVLILCLDGMSEKGVIVGGINHPDRKTTLTDEPKLEGEFNGVNIKVDPDGSTSLTFKGATGNDGKVLDSSQGDTEIKIEKDGTFQLSHKGVIQRLEKGGVASLTAQDNINNTTQKSFNVTAQEDVSITATKNINITGQQLAASISGSATFECQSGRVTASSDFGIKSATLTLEAEGLAKIKAPIVIVEGQVALGGTGGLPVLTLGTTMFGIGNLGLPLLVRPIAGFANKVTAR